MALARVQATGKVTAASAASVALTFATPPTIGNAIIVLAAMYQTAGALTTCSDNRGNTYAKATDHTSNPMQAAIHYCGAVTASAAPFTVTLAFISATGYFEAAALEVSGVGTGLTVDQVVHQGLTSATPSPGTTLAVTGAEVFVAAVHAIGANQASLVVQTVSPAWTQEFENLNYSATVAGEGDTRILTGAAGTTQTCGWTAATSGSWAAALAVFGGTAPALVTVPDVTGDLAADAATALTALGLTVGTTTTTLTDAVLPGYVVSQSPTAGTLVAPGSAVDLVLAVAPGVVITIDGVERRVRLGSMTIRSTINGVDRFSAILDILDAAPVPALGEVLLVTENGTPIFSGVVEAVQQQAVIATTDLSVEVSALDYSIYPSWRIVPALTVPATDVRGILEVLVDYLTPYGVTLDPDQQAGPSMPTMTWEGRTVADILEELARSTGMVWGIDHEKQLGMSFPGDLHAPFDIEDGDGHVVGDIVVTPQDVEYANRIIVRGGPPTPVQVEDRYQGDGTRVTWPVSAPVVSHYNTARIMTTWDGWWDETLGPDATFDWVFDPVANTVTRVRTSATPPPSSSTNPAMDADWQGWFTFMGNKQFLATADDLAGQAARGLREKFVDDSSVTTAAQAQALADGLLARHSRPLRQVEYTTRDAQPLEPNQWQYLQVARRDLDGQFFITEMTIQMSIVYPMLLRTVTLQEGVVVGPARTDIDVPFQGSWRDLYRQWRQVRA